MHRRITLQGDAGAIANLARELAPLEGIIALAHHPGASIVPAGDVLELDVLNLAADEVLRRARPGVDDGRHPLTVAISQTTAVIDPRRRTLIAHDADESLWEEMEADLRNHGRVSVNYVVLMALGGIIAAVAFALEPVSQAIALVGSAIIAPGFEPVAKLAQGLVLAEAKICARAVLSLLVGYAVLLAAAFLVTAALGLFDGGHTRATLRAEPVVAALTGLEPAPLMASACAAAAGILMIVSLRDLYVVGPLMVLVLIAGVALVGAALATGQGTLALGALRRLGADLALVLLAGIVIFFWKQRRFHRRRPLA